MTFAKADSEADIDLGHLPEIERAAMRRLREWLAADEWTALPAYGSALPWPMNACILAGVCPDASADQDVRGLAFLAGSIECYGFAGIPKDEDELFALQEMFAQNLRLARALDLPACKPADAIRFAVRAGFKIPWLDAAKADPLCRALLPHEVAGTPPKLATKNASQQAKAEKRWEGDDARRWLDGRGREVFEELRTKGFAGHWKPNGTVNRSSVAREIVEVIRREAPDVVSSDVTIKNRILKWCPEIDSQINSAVSKNAPAQMK